MADFRFSPHNCLIRIRVFLSKLTFMIFVQTVTNLHRQILYKSMHFNCLYIEYRDVRAQRLADSSVKSDPIRCFNTRNEEMNENGQVQQVALCRYVLTRCTCEHHHYHEIRSSVNYTVEEPKRRQQVIAPDTMPSFNYTLQTMLLLLCSRSPLVFPRSLCSRVSLLFLSFSIKGNDSRDTIYSGSDSSRVPAEED